MTASELTQKITIAVNSSGLDQITEIRTKVDGIGESATTTGSKLGAMADVGKKASLALGAGVLAAGAGFAAFGAMAVGAASDIAESQNKVNVVFGESAGVINDLAATAATSLGQTKAEVLSAAGGIGNLLTAMGQGKAEAAEMSVGMVKLAADLGSFNNASSTDVLAAMQAAMAGETEGMKRFGVAINEVTLKQAAMKAGLGDNVQALSAVQKQQLSWGIMLEQTKSAQGDFANTSDGMANSMKIVKAGLADAKAEIGAGLLPAVEKATAAFSTFLKSAKFDELKDKVIAAFAAIGDKLAQIDWESLADTAVGVFDKITAAVEFLAENPTVAKIVAVLALLASTFGVVMVAIGPFIPIVTSIIGVISGWVTAAGGLSAVLATVGAVLTGPVAIAIAVVVAAFVLWKAKGDEIKAALSAVATAIGEKFTQLKAELSQAWEDIKAAFTAAAQTISQHSDTIKAVILTILTGGLVLLYAGWVQYGDQIKAKAAEIVAWIKQKWEDLKAGTLAKWNEIKAAISAAIDGAKAKITEVLDSIKAAWDAAWTGLGAVAETAWNNMVATISTVFGIIDGLVDTGVAAVRDTFMLAWNTLVLLNDAAWTTIRAAVQIGIDYIQSVIKAGMQLLSGDWRGAWATLYGAAQTAIDKVKALVGALASWLGTLKDSVLQRATDIGRAIGDGIRNALETGWTLVLNKLRALVDLLPQTVRDLLGIASPSRVFAQIGEWITLGLASGIQKSDQKAVAALADVIGKMVSVANGLADFGKKIAEAIVPTDEQLATAKEKYLRMTLILTDFIKSISYLGSLLPVASVGQAGPGQIKAINAGLVQLSQGFPAIKELQGMVAQDLLTGGEADWASKLADMVGKIAGVWGGLADNMTKMAEAKFPSESQLDQLKASTIRIAVWAADSLKNPTLPAVGAAEFAASMKSISDALQTVAGLNLAEIAAVTEGQLATAATNLDRVGAWAYSMMTGPDGWLAKAGSPEDRAAWIASLKDFQDTVAAATGILRAGDVGNLSEIAEVTNEQLRILGANIAKAGEWAWSLMMGPEGWLATAPSREDRAKWIADLKDFADTIGAAVAVAKAAAIGELKAEIEADVIEIRAVLNWVRSNLVPDMVKVADAWKETAEEAKRQTEHMQTFASWLSAAIGLAKVADIGALKGEIEADVIELRAVLNWVKNNLAPEMQKVADAWEVAAKDAALMAERMQSFGGWISAAVGMAKAADVGTLRGDIEADVIEIRAVLNWVKNNLAPEMVKIADAWGETAESAKPMVEKMQAFGGYIKAAVDLAKAADIGTLATVTGTTDLGAKLEIVKANVLAVFGMVGELAQGITTAEATARADLAEALGRGMKALGDFGGGITSLMDLAESKLFGSTAGTPGLGHTQRTRTNRADFYARQLRDTVQRAVQAMQEALAGINIAPNDPKTEAIKQLGEAFGALANGLKAVAETKLPNAQQLAALVAALNGGGGSLGLAGAGAGAGGGAFSIANVRADTATIEGVSIGAVNLTAAMHIDGREIARAVASAMITDVQILDDLGKALGERQARRP